MTISQQQEGGAPSKKHLLLLGKQIYSSDGFPPPRRPEN